MKTNFTWRKQCGNQTFILVRSLFVLVSALFIGGSNVQAQNTDLPNPDPNIKLLPAGTLVIAMDNLYQSNPGSFNLKAYGLVVTLMNAHKRVRWVITAGKLKEGVDISVLAEKAFPVYSAAGTTVKNFLAGPFIIYPADTAGTAGIINQYNNALSASDRVNVYRTMTPVNADVRYDMNGIRPKAAIIDDGGNANIHINYMINAGIPTTNYVNLASATGLTAGCYTFASEPHNGSQGSFIDSIKAFVLAGGNFLAQCHAITSYENWVTGHFQSTQGIESNGVNISSNVAYENNDLSYTQFQGIFDPNIGGAVQVWEYNPGSTPSNNFYPVIHGNIPAYAGIYSASGSKLRTGKGGNVYFLGNHNYNGSTAAKINGMRMYLNAFLTPALTPACPGSTLPVSLKNFSAVKVNEQKVQLNWATASEQNTRMFIIERSLNGVDFKAIAQVTAGGNSTSEKKYSTFDEAPASGRNYYRLATQDLDGKLNYSDIVFVSMNQHNPALDVYPNPARQFVTVNLQNLPASNNQVRVVDLSGKTVIKSTPVNGNAIRLDIGQLTPGCYFLHLLTADGKSFQQRLMVAE